MDQSYIPVTVTKTAERDGVEYAHVTGSHCLEMWIPTSDLAGAPAANNGKAEKLEEAVQGLKDESDALKQEVKALKAENKDLVTEVKALKKAAETKDVKGPREKK